MLCFYVQRWCEVDFHCVFITIYYCTYSWQLAIFLSSYLFWKKRFGNLKLNISKFWQSRISTWNAFCISIYNNSLVVGQWIASHRLWVRFSKILVNIIKFLFPNILKIVYHWTLILVVRCQMCNIIKDLTWTSSNKTIYFRHLTQYNSNIKDLSDNFRHWCFFIEHICKVLERLMW